MTTISMTNALRAFNALNAEIDGLYHRVKTRLGLSDSAANILYALLEMGEGCTPADICRSFGVTRQTVHSSIGNLVRQGILEQRPAGGRGQRLFLTEKGRILAEERVVPVIRLENAVFSRWNEEEIHELTRLLAKYRDDFKAGMATLPVLKAILKDPL